MSEGRRIEIRVPALARVEGEGALDLVIDNNQIAGLRLRIYEPPRLFEKLLEGRAPHEVPDMVARICGICPVAYQMSAVHALESICGIVPGPWVRAMRRLMYCGEWIESHSLHIHLLAAPDFLGFGNVVEMAKRYPEEVRRGLRLQEMGNAIIRFLGARSVNPVGVRIGGFHRAPDVEEATRLREKIRQTVSDARELLRWTAALDIPDQRQDFVCVALRHEAEYPMNEGRLVSSAGLDIAIARFDAHFHEHQVPHSTALHCLLHGLPYLTGPLARVNLNFEKLHPEARAALAETGIAWPSANMFHSIVARAAEIYHAALEAEFLLRDYVPAAAPYHDVSPRAGVGYGCTEAPRGVLWHRYEINEAGLIANARIVPPTSQNQARIEEDLRLSLEEFGLSRAEELLRARAEQVIRNYDPCISCATHFLRLNVTRT